MGTRDNHEHVQCTVACALVLRLVDLSGGCDGCTAIDRARCVVCWRDVVSCRGASPFQELFRVFDDAMIIVSFNGLGFDLPVLRKYYGRANVARYTAHRLKSLDVAARIGSVLGTRCPALSVLLFQNGLDAKTGTGADAVRLWESGRRDELEAYCIADVRLTAQLALLPEIRIDGLAIPSHVYGILPTCSAWMVSEVQVEMAPLRDCRSPSRDGTMARAEVATNAAADLADGSTSTSTPCKDQAETARQASKATRRDADVAARHVG